MRQCCKTCAHLGWDSAMSCSACKKNVIDFASEFGLDIPGQFGPYDAIPALRNGEVVEINGRFFAIEGYIDDDIEQTPKYQQALLEASSMADELLGEAPVELECMNPNIVRLNALTESEQSRLMEEATKLAGGEYAEDVDRDPEEMIARLPKGNRFGFRHRFLGTSIQKAFIEPFTWEFSCDKGVHKFLKQPFTENFASKQKIVAGANNVSHRLAKVMWANDLLKTIDAEQLPSMKCECGAPVVGTHEGSCLWCEDSKIGGNKIVKVYVAKAEKIIALSAQPKALDALITVHDVAAAFPKSFGLAAAFFEKTATMKISTAKTEVA